MTDIHHNQFEETALIRFIGAQTTGPILREIAERRLSDIQNKEKPIEGNLYRKGYPQSVPCYNILNGEKFPTITKAGQSLRVHVTTISEDLRSPVHNYPIRRLIF